MHDAARVAEMLRSTPDTAEGGQLKTIRLYGRGPPGQRPANFLVQEYIARPLLVEGRKFDRPGPSGALKRP